MNSERVILGIDVKSVDLYGEPFAFAWSLINNEGKELDHGCYTCPSEKTVGSDSNRDWMGRNVFPHLPKKVSHKDHDDLCEAVYQLWTKIKTEQEKLGAEVWCVADCQYPVETRLFTRAVRLKHAKREFEGPYPIYELSTALLIGGIDRKSCPRNEKELPENHPLNDARYAARLFLKALNRERGAQKNVKSRL